MEYFTEKIFIYPVKSLGAILCDKININEYGLQNDRRWMIVDRQGNMISQREFPRLNLVKCNVHPMGFQLSYPGKDNCLVFDKELTGTTLQVNIWSSQIIANITQPQASDWISEIIGKNVLIVSANPGARIKKNTHLPNGHELKFQDGYPIHLINTKSVAQIAEWANDILDPIQFRPNLIVDLTNPFEEDNIESWKINGYNFEIVKACERCIMTTIKPNTSNISKEPLATLAKRRKINNHVVFGIYLRAIV